MLAYFQLLRLPTVFTAMADIVLGFVLTHRFVYGPLNSAQDALLERDIGWNDAPSFFMLLASSCCLYLAGMVFNDVFDVNQDTAERPGRPIPSGRISSKSAFRLASILMLAGVAIAGFTSRNSLQVSFLLVLAILGYDSFLKRTWFGPIAMGSCRFLNVLLGGSISAEGFPDFPGQPLLVAAVGLGLFVTGLTLFARTEAKTSHRWHLSLALFVMNLGFAVVVWLIVGCPNNSPVQVSLTMLCVVAFTVNRRGTRAVLDPSPANVQGSIKVLLLSLVMIDATVIYWYSSIPGDMGYGATQALATAALVIPALFLSRFIPMT